MGLQHSFVLKHEDSGAIKSIRVTCAAELESEPGLSVIGDSSGRPPNIKILDAAKGEILHEFAKVDACPVSIAEVRTVPRKAKNSQKSPQSIFKCPKTGLVAIGCNCNGNSEVLGVLLVSAAGLRHGFNAAALVDLRTCPLFSLGTFPALLQEVRWLEGEEAIRVRLAVTEEVAGGIAVGMAKGIMDIVKRRTSGESDIALKKRIVEL